MLPMKFTVQSVAALACPPGKSEAIFWDDAVSGLGVRVYPSGRKVWIVQYRDGKKQKRAALGEPPEIRPDEARAAAKRILAEAVVGIRSEAAAPPAPAYTVRDLFDAHLRAAASTRRPRTNSEADRYLSVVAAAIHPLPAAAVPRTELARLLADAREKRGLVTANRLRSYLHAAWEWGIGAAVIECPNPVATLPKSRETARDRVLTDNEIRSIWTASTGPGYGLIIRLLILTGQRASEVGGMHAGEITGNTWVIPAARHKGRREHDVWMPDRVRSLLPDGWRRFGRGKSGFTGWSQAKSRLDADLGWAPDRGWTVHDIRRTVATRMVELGVEPHVVEEVLGHVGAHRQGVAGIYQRYRYKAEKRAALELWCDFVFSLVDPRDRP